MEERYLLLILSSMRKIISEPEDKYFLKRGEIRGTSVHVCSSYTLGEPCTGLLCHDLWSQIQCSMV